MSRPARAPHRASWTEYQRLRTVGLDPTTTAVLTTERPRPDDERAYWRQLTHHTPTTRAAAQRQRRRVLRTTPSKLGSSS